MGTRFYLRYTEVPDISPGFGVGAPQFDWTAATGAVRCVARTTKLSGDAPQTIGPLSITNNTNLLYTQAITDVLPTGTAFTTSTLVKAQFQVSESAVDDNIFPQLHLKVVSQDGTTLRQELRPATDTVGTEFGTTLQNRAFAIAGASDFLTLPYTTVAGDRLVISVGAAVNAGVSSSASIRFGSDGTDLAELGTETGSTFVPWVELTNLDVFPVPPSAPSGPPVKVGLGLDSGIGWEIDGKPVRMLGDWQAEVATNWGERTFTGTISKDVTWVDQGSTITGWRKTGEPLWQGQVVAEPRIDGDRLHIRGEGFARKLAENRTRMFYRIDGGRDYADHDDDPFAGLTTSEQNFSVNVNPGAIHFRTTPDKAYTVGDNAGAALWVEGGEITRVSYVFHRKTSTTNMDIRTNSFTGPNNTGSLTVEDDYPCNSGDGSTNAFDITTIQDAIDIRLRTNTGFTPTVAHHDWLTGIKAYGRTKDDSFSLSQCCIDVGEASGFGTSGVVSNALLVLPLDWNESHPGLLDYMAELADWLWMIRGDELVVKPYGKVWETATDVGAKPSLEPEPQANRFVQPYRTLSGALRKSVATAQVDPFPGQEITVWGEELEDPQSNSDLADAVAAAAVEYESTFRASGSVELTEVRYLGSVHLPYDVEAGDQLQLTDLAPKLGPQRIEAITYRPNDHATATVGQAFDLVRTLAENERPARRRRRRRRPKGKP